MLRSCWCDIIVLNAHAQTEDKNDYAKDSLYEELEHVFSRLPKHHIKILGYFREKVEREDI
jgi:hypothetical protein